MGGRGGGGSRGLVLDASIKSALTDWAKNASQIRLASIGENKVNGPFYTEFNQQQDNQRAEQIEKFIDGHSVKVTIYRGISDLSDEESKQNEDKLIIDAKIHLFLRKYTSFPLKVNIFLIFSHISN